MGNSSNAVDLRVAVALALDNPDEAVAELQAENAELRAQTAALRVERVDAEERGAYWREILKSRLEVLVEIRALLDADY